MEVHTMPVPAGCTVEFAWMLHCAGVRLDARYGTSWANVEVDKETRQITHVFDDGDKRELLKEMMRGGQ